MRRRAALALASAACVLLLAGCQGGSSGPAQTPSADATVEKSIVYSEADGTPLELDACLPEEPSSTPLPGVVLIHGGAFREGSRSNMLGLCRSLAERGLAAFAIDYRLLPASFPAPVEDTAAAVDWLREPAQKERFGLSGDLALLGSSAGGIIALSAASTLAQQGTPVSAVVSLSAAGDLTSDALKLGDPDPALETVVLAYLGCTTIDDCPQAVAASPRLNPEGLPPTLLVHGSDELIPLQQAEALEEALQGAGVDVTLLVVDGDAHGLQLLDGDTSEQIGNFLVESMSP